MPGGTAENCHVLPESVDEATPEMVPLTVLEATNEPIKAIYAKAGIEFNFSEGYIAELMSFLAEKIKNLEES